MILALVLLLLLRWRLDVMSLGEEEATALGVDVRSVRGAVIIGATLMTAASVSVSGIVGWVGLLVPHLARLIVGPAFARLLPVTLVIGAGFLLLVDTVARTIGVIELPLGVLDGGARHAGLYLAFGARAARRVVSAVIAVEALSFGYPGRTVGAAVSFALEAGEVMCLLGPNGGGKSTLLKTVPVCCRGKRGPSVSKGKIPPIGRRAGARCRSAMCRKAAPDNSPTASPRWC